MDFALEAQWKAAARLEAVASFSASMAATAPPAGRRAGRDRAADGGLVAVRRSVHGTVRSLTPYSPKSASRPRAADRVGIVGAGASAGRAVIRADPRAAVGAPAALGCGGIKPSTTGGGDAQAGRAGR